MAALAKAGDFAGAARYQLDGDGDGLHWAGVVGGAGQQQLDGGAADGGGVLGDDGQAQPQQVGQGEVVEADGGDLARGEAELEQAPALLRDGSTGPYIQAGGPIDG